MESKEIRDAISRIQELSYYLEEEYENNGGEVTDYTEQMEEDIKAMELLLTDGVDDLGRHIKSAEDEIGSYKNEISYLSNRIKAKQRYIGYLKTLINQVLAILGKDKVKGTNGYSFTRTTAVETSVNKEFLNDLFKDRISHILSEANIPSWLGFTLSASVTRAEDCDDVPEGLFIKTERPSTRIGKPRASKEAE